MTRPCCDTHTTPVCCDPLDCGPCCENCPTCPALHREFLSWLTEDERRTFAFIAREKAHAAAFDPLASRPRVLDRDGALRWLHLAAVLVPEMYRDGPLEFYRIHIEEHQ
jgi:hypothetical protein